MVNLYLDKLWAKRRCAAIILPLCSCAIPLLYKLYPVNDFYYGIDTGILLFLGGYLILYGFSVKAGQFKFNLIDSGVLLYLGYCLVNSAFKSPANILSTDSLLYLAALALYFGFKRSLEHKGSLNIFLNMLLICGLMDQLYAILQLLHVFEPISRQYKATGFFLNPDIFCACLTFQLPLIVYYLQTARWRTIAALCAVYIVNTLFFDFFLESRAAILALMIISLFVLLKADASKKAKKIGLICFVAFSIAALPFFTRIKTASSQGRLLIWKVSSAMFFEKPLTGLGLANYKTKYNAYQANYFKKTRSREEILRADENYVPFNGFLGIMIEEGLAGFTLFILLLAIVFFKKAKNENPKEQISAYLKFAIFSFILIAFFSYTMEEPFLFLNFIILIAGISAYHRSHILSIGTRTIAVNIWLIAWGLIYLNKFFYLNKWLTIRNESNISVKAATYPSLLPFLKDNPLFLKDYAEELTNAGRFNFALNIMTKSTHLLPSPGAYTRLAILYDKTGNPMRAECCLKQAAAIIPSKFIFKYNLFNYYKHEGELKKATAVAADIVKMSVKIPSMEVDEIRKDAQQFLNF